MIAGAIELIEMTAAAVGRKMVAATKVFPAVGLGGEDPRRTGAAKACGEDAPAGGDFLEDSPRAVVRSIVGGLLAGGIDEFAVGEEDFGNAIAIEIYFGFVGGGLVKLQRGGTIEEGGILGATALKFCGDTWLGKTPGAEGGLCEGGINGLWGESGGGLEGAAGHKAKGKAQTDEVAMKSLHVWSPD